MLALGFANQLKLGSYSRIRSYKVLQSYPAVITIWYRQKSNYILPAYNYFALSYFGMPCFSLFCILLATSVDQHHSWSCHECELRGYLLHPSSARSFAACPPGISRWVKASTPILAVSFRYSSFLCRICANSKAAILSSSASSTTLAGQEGASTGAHRVGRVRRPGMGQAGGWDGGRGRTVFLISLPSTFLTSHLRLSSLPISTCT